MDKCKFITSKGQCKSPINQSQKYCDEIPIEWCYYKQLQKALKENDKLKQALEEIKEDLETSSYCESTECGNDNYGACIECMTKRYLDAINEVLNEK